MRPLFVLPALEENGGVRLVLRLVSELQRLGAPAEIFSVRSRAEGGLDPSFVQVPVMFGADAPARLRRSAPVLLPRLYRAARLADLVVSAYELGPGLMFAALAGRMARRPVVAMVQSNLEHSLPGVPRRDRLLARAIYPRLDGVICVCADLAPTLRVLTPRPIAALGCAENGVDLPALRAAAARPPEVPLRDGPVLVAVGRLGDPKGYDTLIRAHAAVLAGGRPHSLLFLGEGQQRSSLEALARALGVGDTVDFAGYCQNPHSVVARAALFVLPSRYEGFPLALLEALALGAPIVATDCIAGPRRILDGGAYGDLVPVDSPSALAEAIARHLDAPERLRCMAAAGRRWAEQFTLEHCARAHLTFYADIIGSSARKRPGRGRA